MSRIALQHADRRPIIFTWGVSSYHSYGIYGLQLLLQLANHPKYRPLCARAFGASDIVLDPLDLDRLIHASADSPLLWRALEAASDRDVIVDHPVFEGLADDLHCADVLGHRYLSGQPSIGFVGIAKASLDADALRRAERFPLFVTANQWNAEILHSHGIERTVTIMQGTDEAFHPGPRRGLWPGRFVVFSGGKIEYRKGLDIVLSAFRRFQRRHPEALLLTAWSSPWTAFVGGAVGRPDIVPVPQAADGTPDIVGWAVANGIPRDAIAVVGPAPNILMPPVMREADVAVFPARCEAGTNLVAMETMACGVPTILSANTGHRDLLEHDIALALDVQPAPARAGVDVSGWGESDVDEIVAKLELIWYDRMMAHALGARAAHFMAGRRWSHHVAKLMAAVEPYIHDK